MSTFSNRLQVLNAQGKVCKAFGIKFISTHELPRFAANAGFDSLFIDLEHSVLSLKTANELSLGALSAGLSPFVRVPGRCGPGFVQRVLDGGAQGVIFPHVDTVDQALEAVKACKYPPLGKRSITGGLPQYDYKPMPFSEAISQGNSSQSSVFVMMESQEAVDNVDQIAAIEGVDVILVGTNDLAVELGIPGQWESPIFLKAFDKIAKATKRHGKVLAVAGIYNRPDFIEKCIHEYGVGWFVAQHDMNMMMQFMQSTVDEFTALEAKQENGVKDNHCFP